jgi:hypothetical protein
MRKPHLDVSQQLQIAHGRLEMGSRPARLADARSTRKFVNFGGLYEPGGQADPAESRDAARGKITRENAL